MPNSRLDNTRASALPTPRIKHGADHRQRHPLDDDHPANVGALRPKRDANTDFASTLADTVGHHASIGPIAASTSATPANSVSSTMLKRRPAKRFPDPILDRPHVSNRLIGIQLGDLVTHQSCRRERIAYRPDDDVNRPDRPVIEQWLLYGTYSSRPIAGVERPMFDVADDAHDLVPSEARSC